jgi:hypothetical protein
MEAKLMSLNEFNIYPMLWYIFATIVAFVAAILFWRRGSSAAEGEAPGSSVKWKITGAGAIFVIVILTFHFINPLKPLSDYKKILIIYSNKNDIPNIAETLKYAKIAQSQIQSDYVDFTPDSLHVQLIPLKYIYELSPELSENCFVTHDAIPLGKYKIRFTSYKTGQSKEFTLDIKEDEKNNNN